MPCPRSCSCGSICMPASSSRTPSSAWRSPSNACATYCAARALADYAQQAADRLQLRWPFRLPRPSPVTFALNGAVLAALASVVLLASAPSLLERVDGKLVARDFPIKAADFLSKHPAPGHMLNVYGWGGYLIFRLDRDSP